MSLKTKVQWLLAMLIATVLITGFISFYATNKLSSSLDYISGPAWNAADGAMETTIGVQGQIMSLQNYTTKFAQLHPKYAQQQLDLTLQFKEVMEEAFARVKTSGLVEQTDIQMLESMIVEFTDNEKKMISAYNQYSSVSENYRRLFGEFQSFMTELEEVGDSAVEYLEQNSDQRLSWNSGLAERWGAADGGMESQIAMLQMQYNLQEYINSGGESKYLNAFNEAQKDFSELTKEITAHRLFQTTSPKSSTKNGSFAQQISVFGSQYRQIAADLVSNWDVYFEIQKSNQALATRFLDKLELVEEISDSKVENEASAIAGIEKVVLTMLAVALIINLLIMVLAGWGMSRYVVRPIRKIAKTLESNPNDFGIRLDDSKNDEIGQLAKAINQCFAQTGQTLKKIEEVSYLVESMSLLLQHSSQVAAEDITIQDKETEQSAKSIHELSTTIAKLSQNATEAAELASNTAEDSNTGFNFVTSSKRQVHELATNIESMSTAIQNLNSDTESISSVLDVIRGIAEQTNLLALNAAIEAARAGEQGRGFAVVADEVRSLASRTADSTSEIQTTINALLESSRSVVSAMEQSSRQTNETVKQIGATEESFASISQSVKEISDLNEQVAQTTESQSVTSEQISNSLLNISDLAKQSLETSDMVKSVSEGLGKVSKNLSKEVAEFKV